MCLIIWLPLSLDQKKCQETWKNIHSSLWEAQNELVHKHCACELRAPFFPGMVSCSVVTMCSACICVWLEFLNCSHIHLHYVDFTDGDKQLHESPCLWLLSDFFKNEALPLIFVESLVVCSLLSASRSHYGAWHFCDNHSNLFFFNWPSLKCREKCHPLLRSMKQRHSKACMFVLFCL